MVRCMRVMRVGHIGQCGLKAGSRVAEVRRDFSEGLGRVVHDVYGSELAYAGPW